MDKVLKKSLENKLQIETIATHARASKLQREQQSWHFC